MADRGTLFEAVMVVKHITRSVDKQITPNTSLLKVPESVLCPFQTEFQSQHALFPVFGARRMTSLES